MLKVLIVDDEQHAREMLNSALQMCQTESIVVGSAETVKDTLEKAKTLNPDIILLDINLPDGTGFDVIEQLENEHISIIFVTAYDNYAIKAFKFSAVDYLVKPIDVDELEVALERAKERKEKSNIGNKLRVLIDSMNNANPEDKKIVLRTHESIHIVKVCEIIHCKSDQNYTEFFLTQNRKFLVSRTIKEFDEILKDYSFFRSHQSHLININRISHFDKTDGGALVMEDRTNIPVSKRKRSELFDLFDSM